MSSPPLSPEPSQGMEETKNTTPNIIQSTPLFNNNNNNNNVPSSQPRVLFSGTTTPSLGRNRRVNSETPPGASIRGSVHSSLPRGDLGRTTGIIPATPFSPNLSQNAAPNLIPSSQLRPTSTSGGIAALAYDDNDDEGGGDDHLMIVEDDEALAAATSAFGPLAEVRIWGTEINVHTCRNIFTHFLENYGKRPFATTSSSSTSSSSSLSFYQKALLEMMKTKEFILNINCSHFRSHVSTHHFYHQIIQFPQEIIPILDIVANEQYQSLLRQQRRRSSGGGNQQQLVRLGQGEEEAEGGEGGEDLLLSQAMIQVRLYGLTETCRLRGLNPENIETLISVKGMVIRVSAIIPDLKIAFFRCTVCNHELSIPIERGRIEEPNSCPQCQTIGSLDLLHNRCSFSDKQMIRLQETPDEIPEGETPQTINIFAFDDLVDTVRPGDRLEVTGIFRAIPRRVNPRMRNVRSVFKTYLDAIHFRRAGYGGNSGDERMTLDENPYSETTRNTPMKAAAAAAAGNGPFGDDGNGDDLQHHQDDSDRHTFTRQRIQEFHQFASSRNVEERLVKSFAPSIWEMDDVKKGLLCLLFGGTIKRKAKRHFQNRSSQSQTQSQLFSTSSSGERKDQEGDAMIQEDDGNDRFEIDDEDDNGIHHRGDINILLCGDPGTSKSQLLSYVHKLTPRGIYTSGKGSSAVGLTASIVRDPETREHVLESGALVLSDNGICCIDEFDKMSDQTRAILHEAMEQQTVSITKAGIIATLNARTSILASANPVQSRYNPRLSVVDNIKLPPTLLSRFDLIYLILDKPNPETDRRLAKHLVSLYYADEEDDEEETDRQQHDTEFANNNPVEPVDQTFLKEFILYARYNIFPEISEEAEDLLVNNYVSMRSIGNSTKGMKIITATPRQLESLIRLSQALAKMHLSNWVTPEHVIEATRLMKVATQTAATDPRTGTIDMDLISTGRTALDRDLILKLSDEMRRVFENYSNGQRLGLQQIRQLLLNVNSHNRGGGGGGGYDNTYDNNSILGSLSLLEIEDAARKLESDGVIQFIERTQTIIIRNNNKSSTINNLNGDDF